MPNFNKTAEELQTNFDKWVFALQQLPYLQNRPTALQEKVFQKLFEAAEIASFAPEEKINCEESLKYYRDLKNALDTSFEKGRVEGRGESREEFRRAVARQMKSKGEAVEKITQLTGLTEEQIAALQ